MGGSNPNHALFEVRGWHAPVVVPLFRGAYPVHNVARADVKSDFDSDLGFLNLVSDCWDVKSEFNLYGQRLGDWDHHPEQPGTLYLGKRGQCAFMRLYEKGKMPQFLDVKRPDWVRLEFEIRPDHYQKQRFATLTPLEMLGARVLGRAFGRASASQR